jgi:hypothetical protein
MIAWLLMCRQIIAEFFENLTKRINRPTLCKQNTVLVGVKAGGTYNYHLALKKCVKRLGAAVSTVSISGGSILKSQPKHRLPLLMFSWFS